MCPNRKILVQEHYIVQEFINSNHTLHLHGISEIRHKKNFFRETEKYV